MRWRRASACRSPPRRRSNRADECQPRMRIAFYAPLKPPDHPVPSGDRRMARLLMTALRHAGHEVDLASRLRSRDGGGDPLRQARIERAGLATADRLLRGYR